MLRAVKQSYGSPIILGVRRESCLMWDPFATAWSLGPVNNMNKTTMVVGLLALTMFAIPNTSAAELDFAPAVSADQRDCVGYQNDDRCIGYCEDQEPGETCDGICGDPTCQSILDLLGGGGSGDATHTQSAMGDCIGYYSNGRCTGYETGTCTQIVPQRTIYNPLTGSAIATVGPYSFCY